MTENRMRQLLTYNKWIESRVDQLTKQVNDTDLDPVCKASDMVIKCHEFANISVCDVSCVADLPPDCTVSGPVVISDPVKVTVTLIDIFGSPVTDQSKYLEICCSKEREFLQNTKIEEKSKGQYHVWYNPKKAENHSLSVNWKGLALNHDKIKVSVNLRDYTTIKQEVKIIKEADGKHLEDPYVLAKGPNNELIVRNNSTKQLIVFDKHFKYSHLIGEAGSRNGKFQNITGIAVDKNRYLYVADYDLNCIQKFELSGKFMSQFGSEGTANGQFKSPCGLVMSQSKLLFVCDNGNHRIQVFQNEQFSYYFGQCGSKPGDFNDPKDVTLNYAEDQLFITDHQNNRVQVFTVKGQFLKIFGDFSGIPFELQHPIGIYYTPDQCLLISSSGNNCVLVFKEDGKFISAIEGTYRHKESFSYPCGVVMMDDGQIVIAAGSNGEKLVVF